MPGPTLYCGVSAIEPLIPAATICPSSPYDWPLVIRRGRANGFDSWHVINFLFLSNLVSFTGEHLVTQSNSLFKHSLAYQTVPRNAQRRRREGTSLPFCQTIPQTVTPRDAEGEGCPSASAPLGVTWDGLASHTNSSSIVTVPFSHFLCSAECPKSVSSCKLTDCHTKVHVHGYLIQRVLEVCASLRTYVWVDGGVDVANS